MAKKKNKKQSKAWRMIKLATKIILLILLNVILVLGLLFYNKYGKSILNLQKEARILVNESTLDTFRQIETSLVYDVNGKLLSTLKGSKDVYYIEYTDIPDYATEAMVSIEDKKFYEHKGVDYKAIIRATVALVRNKGEIKQGASTITQQLSRNIFLSHEVSWERKMKEMFIGMELEKKYEKYQILEFYLNNIYFANGYYGIEAASKGYFSKGVNKLSLSQVVFLCAIPNNPTLYNPVDNHENTIKRRDRILLQMLEDGKIAKEEYIDAIHEEITLKRSKIKRNNYVETYVYYCAIKELMKKQGFVFQNQFASEKEEQEYNELYNEYYNQCQQSLYQAGYRIYTSIDPEIQKTLQSKVDETLKGFTEKNKEGIYLLQGAATVIDNSTGRVSAIVGGRSQSFDGYTLNRAYQSYRQPGSAIKPLIVYAPAFQLGYDPSQIVLDEKFEGGPKNSGNVYSGKITLRTAIEKSKNVVAWKMFEEISPAFGLSFIQKMGFQKISKNDYYPAASLGGFTYGVSSVEMAAGFATIVNDGIYREPTSIIRITDSNGELIVGDHIIPVPVYEENAARMMTSVLEGVIKNGTGRGLGLSNMHSAGKTGTTDDSKDGWFVGYTPYYTTSVWVGYDTPKSLKGLWGSSYPGTIWKTFMNELHKDLENKAFSDYISHIKEPPIEEIVEEEMEEEVPIEENDIEEENGKIEEYPPPMEDIEGEDDHNIPDESIPNEQIPEVPDTIPEAPVEEDGNEGIPEEEIETSIPVDMNS